MTFNLIFNKDIRPRETRFPGENSCEGNQCPCPRCSWVQIRNDTADGGYTDAAGDSTCESGNFDILPDKDACVAFQSNKLSASPGVMDGPVGGSCSIMQEVVTLPVMQFLQVFIYDLKTMTYLKLTQR